MLLNEPLCMGAVAVTAVMAVGRVVVFRRFTCAVININVLERYCRYFIIYTVLVFLLQMFFINDMKV